MYYREQRRHIKCLHIKLFPVALVTGPPGRVSGQKDLCSLGSEDSTQNFDPWAPASRSGEPPGHRRGHRPKRFMFMCLFLSWSCGSKSSWAHNRCVIGRSLKVSCISCAQEIANVSTTNRQDETWSWDLRRGRAQKISIFRVRRFTESPQSLEYWFLNGNHFPNFFRLSAPKTRPNHIRTVSEPYPNRIRTAWSASEQHPKEWWKLREKRFLVFRSFLTFLCFGARKRSHTNGVFSLEESLESLISLDSLESLKNSWILLCFPQSGDPLESLESLNSVDSLESLENGFFWKDPFSKRPLFQTRLFKGKAWKRAHHLIDAFCSLEYLFTVLGRTLKSSAGFRYPHVAFCMTSGVARIYSHMPWGC